MGVSKTSFPSAGVTAKNDIRERDRFQAIVDYIKNGELNVFVNEEKQILTSFAWSPW